MVGDSGGRESAIFCSRTPAKFGVKTYGTAQISYDDWVRGLASRYCVASQIV